MTWVEIMQAKYSMHLEFFLLHQEDFTSSRFILVVSFSD